MTGNFNQWSVVALCECKLQQLFGTEFYSVFHLVRPVPELDFGFLLIEHL